MKTETKRKLVFVAFPFVWIWFAIAYVLFKFGDCLRNIGNRMSGYRLDDSIGTLHIN